MRNLYEILGVEPSAGPEEIKHAYRRLSMKMHPDRGGEHEDFAEMKAAYEVLIDSDRRAKYDATGSTEVETPLREKAEKMVVALANEAIHEVAQLVFAPFETTDLVARIRSKMHEAIRGGEKQKVDLHAHQAKLEGIIKRFKRSSGENLIAALLAQKKSNATSKATRSTSCCWKRCWSCWRRTATRSTRPSLAEEALCQKKKKKSCSPH
jgi:DnaJ-class molecular chaperone